MKHERENENIWKKVQRKISQLKKLDPNIVEIPNEIYYQEDQEYIYVAKRFVENATVDKDLYYLKHVRSTFSEDEIGQFAQQLLT